MKKIINKELIIAALIRAVRTMAQTAGSLLTGAIILQDANWLYIASASALAGIYSLIMSIGGLPEVEVKHED